MSDAIDDVTEEATDAQQEEEIVSRVLDELGINLDQSVRRLPSPESLYSAVLMLCVAACRARARPGGEAAVDG